MFVSPRQNVGKVCHIVHKPRTKGGIMAAKGTEKVKNVVLVGQGGVGKTMLAEAMLHRHRADCLGGYAPERS